MCGLVVYVLRVSSENDGSEGKVASTCDELDQVFRQVLTGRGQDGWRTVRRTSHGENKSWMMTVGASTLSLRGGGPDQHVLPREEVSEHGDGALLGWNGEVFEWTGRSEWEGRGSSGSLGTDENDSDAVLCALGMARQGDDEDLLTLLDSIRGPWALVYFDPFRRRLWWGRDRMGRRSLLMNVAAHPDIHGMNRNQQPVRFWVASVCPLSLQTENVVEVPTNGLWYMDLDTGRVSVIPRASWSLEVIPERDPRGAPRHENWARTSFLPASTRRSGKVFLPMKEAQALERFLSEMCQAVDRRLVGLGTRGETNIGILFSGGLDSLVLARLAMEQMSSNFLHASVDLINVSFGSAPFDSPDRQSSIQAFQELDKLARIQFCNVKLKLLLVDVSMDEADEKRSEIAQLIYPCDTPMDHSIRSALWFASKAHGRNFETGVVETSETKVLLSGLGADELLAGYKGRHRSVHARGGDASLLQELDADLSRLWWRNLGRDDRVVSAHNRELRHPFLDESLVQLICDIEPRHLFNMTLPDGIGDKMILRRAACCLGLSESLSQRPKKALQFGSNSKKIIESKKERR